MKKTKIILLLSLGVFALKAQTTVIDFETFTLSPNSAYSSTTNVPFQNNNVSFQYKWNAAFNYWSGGFSYTNKYDSATVGFGNLYGVKPLKGYNNSNTYVIGKDAGVINLGASSNTVNGFYITNTTYTYKSMKLGDSFAKKFGGISGNDPDYLKLSVKGFKGGILKSDSVIFYLADYRSANNSLDYIVNNWQWVNTAGLGDVDSIKFLMYSSDIGSFGINTPLFFGMDNFTINQTIVGLNENTNDLEFNVYPNPCDNLLSIDIDLLNQSSITISDISGKIIYHQKLNFMQTILDVSSLNSGIYFLELLSDNKKQIKKIIKN